MTRTIQQRVTFNASPERLFKLYTDSKQHSAATQGKARTAAHATASAPASQCTPRSRSPTRPPHQ